MNKNSRKVFRIWTNVFLQSLGKCFVDNNINQSQGKALLNVLRSYPQLQFVPKDSRSLLQTPRDRIDVEDMPPGQYLHIGIQSTIFSILSGKLLHPVPEELLVDFSTDGAELNKNTQMWPLQIRLVNFVYNKPELVGIYVGEKKPASFKHFFANFVKEAQQIIKDGGIMYRNTRILIKFRCFIADAPARSYVLNHISHIGMKPCSKCEVQGERFQHSTRYKGINHKVRTNKDYRDLVDTEHHTELSAIDGLPMDLVKQVPFDYMHLLCLGVMKKLIEAICFGKCMARKLPTYSIEFLSQRLIILHSFCPREFARIPRELDKYTKYKATEFRQLLLYTFIVIML
ncbi:uncharacterized protein LOC141538430 [Cotesia typhae]|uniref:uncharacterized protein LOC141538430 n=1 Tax=Cotesia typhae TaxID=2053667 RepID=UPI003D690F3D